MHTSHASVYWCDVLSLQCIFIWHLYYTKMLLPWNKESFIQQELVASFLASVADAT